MEISEKSIQRVMITCFVISVFIFCAIILTNAFPPKCSVINESLSNIGNHRALIEARWFLYSLQAEEKTLNKQKIGVVYFRVVPDSVICCIPYSYRRFIHYPRHMGVEITIFSITLDGRIKKIPLENDNSFTYNKGESVVIRVSGSEIPLDSIYFENIVIRETK